MTVQLTKFQLFLLMFVLQTGFVYISFQNLIIEHGKRDATIQFLAIALLFFLQLLFFERTYQYFVLNRFIKAIYLIYWYLYVLIFIVYITYVLTTWAFPNTPTYVIISIFLSVCFYASISRPETAVNIGVILLPMLVLFLVFLFLTYSNLQVTNLLPLFYDRSETWWLGFVYATYAFGGAEIYVFLRKYVMKDQKITKKTLAVYFTVLTIFYLLSIAMTLMYFALDEIKLVPEPILYILHSVKVTFVKRLDLFFVYIWLSWSLVTIVNFTLVMRLVYFEKKRKAPVLKQLLLFVVMGVTANMLIRFSLLEYFKVYLIYVIIVFTFLIPILVIIVNKIRGKTISDSSTSS